MGKQVKDFDAKDERAALDSIESESRTTPCPKTTSA
jgi:hypothetical protein